MREAARTDETKAPEAPARPVAAKPTTKAAQNGNRFSSFVLGVVNSAAFQMARAEPAVTTTLER